jgi:hypothetical protein
MTAGTSVQKGTQSFWVKRGLLATTINVGMCAEAAVYPSGGAFNVIQFTSSDTLQVQCYNGSSNDLNLITTQVFRDPSAWYHIVVAWDTTQATAANRAIVYVNGTQVTAFSTATYPAQNTNFTGWGASNVYTIGTDKNNSNVFVRFFDGYLAEFNYVDGQQLAVTSFGSTNALTGVWQPASYTGSYGTNGFELNFTDNSALTTSSNVGLGKDFSGNANYWVTNNISITAGVTYDSMTDVPTLTSATAANFAVLNPVAPLTQGLTNGNLNMTGTATVYSSGRSTIAIPAGTKIYWECAATAWAGGSSFQIGMVPTTYAGGNSGANYVGMQGGGNTFNMGSISSIGTFALNNVMGLAYDQAAGTLAIYKNNTLLGTISSVSTTLSFMPRLDCYTTTESGWINFGQRPFTYTPPTGFVALNTYNLPTSTIVKGNTVMDATLWTGTGASQAVTNAGAFKPDFAWLKIRSGAANHILIDSVRGVTNYLNSNTTNAEASSADQFLSFNSNGFTVGANTTGGNTNQSGSTYVGWQWQAGQGSTSSNTNGTITSTVSVNASAGFSVVTWTGTGANATVGHGLGVAPQLIINKPRNAADNWISWHTSLGALGYIYLNLTNASASAAAVWNSTLPTSSVFSVGTSSNINSSAQTMVSYCWTPIAGFSAFGSYSGNNSTDGPMVYTGFQPKFVLIKGTGNASGWQLQDSARNTYNVVNAVLRPDLSAAESTGYGGVLDFLSNGFKLRTTDTNYNSSSYGPYIYMAFATNPFKNSLGV